jgi:MFS family permease
MKFISRISRTVWVLSLVSLFTDISSEMLYPIMPIYLKSIGFSIVLIGILEGFAEATAGLSKGYFGKLSDIKNKRLPFVQLGYLFSAVSKPMIALFTNAWWIFSARTLDRLGKGIRTGARDALLSDSATPETKGTVFGFHRAMDTIGAAIGPMVALAFLYFFPGEYRILFFIAFIPGLIGVFTTLLIKEKKSQSAPSKTKNTFFSFLKYIPQSHKEYKILLIGLLAFTLFNSSDVFLLLMLKHQGMSDTGLIGVYIFYNLIYALFSYPVGIIADKIGFKRIFVIGLIIFSGVYLGMAFNTATIGFYVLFFFYGIFAACTEGVSKAWISNISDKKDTATAIGTYEAFKSIATLIASSVAGLIWQFSGASTSFLVTAIAVIFVSLYFIVISGRKVEIQK